LVKSEGPCFRYILRIYKAIFIIRMLVKTCLLVCLLLFSH